MYQQPTAQAAERVATDRSRSIIERLLRRAILQIGRLFYPRVVLIGAVPPGPTIITANHPNGLLDGLALLLMVEQPIAFLAKSTFFANPLLATVLRAFGAIPVYRPADHGKPGGAPSDQHDANQAPFAAARKLLQDGGHVVIFPEGTPNPQPELLPLKTGTARIACEAEHESEWSLNLRIVPIGLWFADQAQPRTAALAVVGEPIAVAELRTRYEENSHAAIHGLTTRLQTELQTTATAARQAGSDRLHNPTLWGTDANQRPTWLRVVGAPFALIGFLLALPGLGISNLLHWLLTRRHRATVGTAHLVALVAGLGMGWMLSILVAAWLGGPIAALIILFANPLCGFVALSAPSNQSAG